MKRARLVLFLFILLAFVPSAAHAQAWSGILDPTRAIDWSTAGVPGGIPSGSWTQCGSTIQASTYGNGASDATSGIQTALNGCGANQFVLLSSGTFLINSYLVIPSNVVLRGGGANNTTLKLNGSGDSAIRFGNSSNSSQWPVAAGTSTTMSTASKGATSIAVASASGIGVGSLLMLTQTNYSYMTEAGHGGTCSWCNGGFGGDSGQIVRVTNVAGTTLTIDPPLYINYSNSPVVYRFNRAAAVNAGLESLKISSFNTGYTVVILMEGAYASWVKGVENDFADNAHMWMYHDTHCEVRDSFFHDGYNHGPGGTDNQLTLGHKTSASLIINNIFWRQHVSVMFEWGSSGNVVAYNYLDGNYHQSQLSWHQSDIDWHGAHPMMNLLEGNIGNFNQVDDYWGSSSHTTFFRTYAKGAHQYVPPMNARGALQVGSAQWEDGGNDFAYDVNDLQVYNNLVGVIAGSPHATSMGYAGVKISPASAFGNSVCIRYGYDGSNDASISLNTTYSTAFIHGVYDCALGISTWTNGVTQTLPASFFLSVKPSWWGTLPWPAIGPDVTGGNIAGVNGHANAIPAMNCFNTVTANGTTNTTTFNATACYGGTSGTPPSPPTGLAGIVL